ncbi:MAG TPA: rhodanese-like domain-containing protein [Pyrinomonadaceae bacterium]|nr:rhodanese-like domain-containing protein [Pyrinomonadaceae bacterium]
MNYKKSGVLMLLILSGWLSLTGFKPTNPVAVVSAQSKPNENAATFITAEELKEKMSRNENVTIIDVRSTESYIHSDSTIKGAIFVKLRRLNSRLGFPPLKSVPRDSEVITYCACPNDEASLHAVEILSAAGFKRARALKGGWRMWLKVNGPVSARPKAG